MEKFSLAEAYLLGNGPMDRQHRMILEHMAKVYAGLLAGEKGRDLSEAVDRLDAYCKLHLLDEEKAMEEMDFPERGDHEAQHALFIRHLENFTGRYREQDITKNVEELVFLKNWFVEHIGQFDKKYAGFKKTA
jgi:hemerythrin-like metal-binding protein